MSAELTLIKRKSRKIMRAEQRIEFYKAKLKCKIPSFSYSLSQLIAVPVREEIFLCTDGKKLFYNPKQIMEEKVGSIEEVLCHIVLHGLFGHFEKTAVSYQNAKLASAVRDIQVAHAMEALHPAFTMKAKQKKALMDLALSPKRRKIFGDDLYYAGLKDMGIRNRIYNLGKSLYREDHSFWMKCTAQLEKEEGNSIWENARKLLLGTRPKEKGQEGGSLVTIVMQNLLGKQYSAQSMKNVWLISDEKVSMTAYDVLLRELASITEKNKEEDEIDKALYMYGLDMYGDVPILEPVESTECRQINSIVIALDTSGSCVERIPGFLKETKKLFEDIQGAYDVESIYLMQCDCDLHSVTEYYNLSEFSENASNFNVIGGGGTSFVPVFKRIEEIQKKRKVDILFYLTDGCGIYPVKKPEYPVCFLMAPEDVDCNIEYVGEPIPEWIKKYPVLMEE